MLLKAQPGSDEFISEKYAAQIDAILRSWAAALLKSPLDLGAIAAVLTPSFSGASLRAAESKLLRAGLVEIYRNEFNPPTTLESAAFLTHFRDALSSFTQLFTAEFQITHIDLAPAYKNLRTRVR